MPTEMPSQATEPMEPAEQENESQEIDIRKLIESKNIAEGLDEEVLMDISEHCKRGFEYDLESTKNWRSQLADWVKLAGLKTEKKSFPWEDASNIKYPLITTAAMQFSARAYPSLVPANGNVVAGVVIGQDPDGLKAARASRISKYMSWQCMHQMDNWEEEFDRKLMALAIKGNVYKKTYYDATKGYNVSKTIPVERFVVHYWTRSLEEAERISEIFYLYPRQVDSRQAAGYFLKDVELGEPVLPEVLDNKEFDDSLVEMIPHTFVEQHTYWDLNKDGHKEPYIVTFELQTGKIVRITARFDHEGIVTVQDKKGKEKIIDIKPLMYYTKYGFIPNPDGSFLDYGFGHLLGPINESINTGVNQLTDAGTLANMQAGFLGKGLRVKGGDYRLTPGEWKWVNATGDDLRKQIIPLPVKEPSAVLFQLVEFLLQAGKELASVAEIFVGKMPGQNTPATTTMASIEQGMKVFTAIYKRCYRSLSEEFQKLFALNHVYLDEEHYKEIVDDPQATAADWEEDGYDICPAADPTATSQQEKVAKAQALLELMPLGLKPDEVLSRILQAQEQPNWEKLIPGLVETGKAAPPPPDPKMQEMNMKMQMDKESAAIKNQTIQQTAAVKNRSIEVQTAMKAQQAQVDLNAKLAKNHAEALSREHNQKVFMQQAQTKAVADTVGATQKIVHTEQQHQQKMRHNAEAAKSKSQSTSTTGKSGKKTK